jgi:hypothetical protein
MVFGIILAVILIAFPVIASVADRVRRRNRGAYAASVGLTLVRVLLFVFVRRRGQLVGR